LSVKLGAFGGLVTAAVVAASFIALSAEVRANTRDQFAAQLARNRQTIRQLQTRDANQFLFAASIIAQSSSFEAALSTYQLERNSGIRSPDAVNTAEDALRDALAGIDADLLLATDDSGAVLAEASRRGVDVPHGRSLLSVAAVRHALDPNAPADTGAMAVLRTDSGFVEVAVYPVVQRGFTLGALVLGRRLDSAFVASQSATLDADVILAGGDTIIATTNAALAAGGAAARLRAHAASSDATLRIGDDEYVVAPVTIGDGGASGTVRLWMLQSLTGRVAALMRPLRVQFIVYGLLAVAISTLGIAVVTRRVLTPFQRFVRYLRSGATAEERQGRFDSANEAREIRTLDESYNQLMDSLAARRRDLEKRSAELVAANVVLTDEVNERVRVEQALRESQAQLRQSQKLEAIGTLAGGIAHDFNNLITVISGYTQLALMRTTKTSPEADDLRQVIDASDRAANLTHQLLAFSRKQVLQPTVLDVGEVVNGIAPMLRRIIGEHIVLTIEGDASLARVRADRGQLEQVLLNLAVNARDAMPGGGSLVIATQNSGIEDERAAAVTLTVRDTGSGMSDEVKERIFEPFFTTKEPGKGTGLGLSTVYGIVNQSGGTIRVDSVLGGGTTFLIALPAVDAVATGGPAEMAEADLPRGSETVLIVEDADDVRTLARRTLEERGYTVRVARNADEAMEIATALRVDVLLTDVVMPQMSGPQLVERFLARYPGTLVIFMSGYADDALAQYGLAASEVFLRKPFTPATLLRTLRDALDRSAAASDAVAAAGGMTAR
jgi:signal transduction histidine kinase/ActR/RegA family two-component response regulator